MGLKRLGLSTHSKESKVSSQSNVQLGTLTRFFLETYPLGAEILSSFYFNPVPKLSVVLVGNAHDRPYLLFLLSTEQIASLIRFPSLSPASVRPSRLRWPFSELVV